MLLITHLKSSMAPFNIAQLVLDLDSLAERYMIADRKSGEVLVSQRVDKKTVVCPLNYATSNNLFIVMLDDDMDYNAAIADGVRPEIVEAIAAGL
ncbi:hypothetical protein Q4Q54_11055 [Shewanella sp. SP2S2-4]|uniref:hypothetical protein n=1 Tax=Shewanella sp. SP2S2-4 TaxID=3063539 RepID=UPI00288D52BF|nr:hypothetical protein [Shewanella sp. SP2S2-4]MDT3274021.1 hypothetical protein [Shewanella sp. SP2S2-4]